MPADVRNTEHAQHRRRVTQEGTVGVLLVNTGTPVDPSVKSIRKYLGKFLMDRRIRPMNSFVWWILLHTRVLRRRANEISAEYETLYKDGEFAFNTVHKKIITGLNTYYQDNDLPVVAAYAMSYSVPSIESALEQLKEKGCTRLVVLPLYPQSAYCTTGAVQDGVEKALRKTHWDVECELVENYYEDSQYIQALAASLRHAGFNSDSDDEILFSFHSIPLCDIDDGDTYELQVGATCLAIADNLNIVRYQWTIGYQCQFDNGRRWLSPFTRETLSSRAENAPNNRLFIICPNFSVDCLETTYEILDEIIPEYKQKRAQNERSQNAGAQNKSTQNTTAQSRSVHNRTASDDLQNDSKEEIIYVPCLNASKAHLKVLIHVLAPYVEKSN